MLLEALIKGVEKEHLGGPSAERVDVSLITSDSRRVSGGVLFVAVSGTIRDGHEFAVQAAEAGAAAIVVEREIDGLENFSDTTILKVPSARAALALMLSNFHGRPGEKLPLIGITGTNGKTTVAWLVAKVAEYAGQSVGLVGTLGVGRMGKVLPAQHTTPGPEILQELLATMSREGHELAVMEVSSHALDQDRVLGCRYSRAAFTGLSRDHLDYHSSIEEYYLAKTRLFTEHLADGAPAFIFVDDPYGRRLYSSLRQGGRVRPIAVSFERSEGGASSVLDADQGVIVRSAALSLTGISADIELPDGSMVSVKSSLIGEHNLENISLALALLNDLGIEKEKIVAGFSACGGVPGRLERVSDSSGQGRYLFVDYAHTDDAISRIVSGLRKMASPEARIISVGGCGGDRDKGKRPLMGKALTSADVAVITTDNPRGEDPFRIVQDMLPGLIGSRCMIELDRRKAIETALAIARTGDIVLVAGKGHESVQVVGNEEMPFDDREESSMALAGVEAGTESLPPVFEGFTECSST